jgi:hypothetical protein
LGVPGLLIRKKRFGTIWTEKGIEDKKKRLKKMYIYMIRREWRRRRRRRGRRAGSVSMTEYYQAEGLYLPARVVVQGKCTIPFQRPAAE